MKRIMSKITMWLFAILALFGFFWFANSGFNSDSWQTLAVALVLTAVACVVVINKISNILWFWLIIILFIFSTLFEIFKLMEFADIFASISFGILLIFLTWNSIKIYRK